MKYTLSPWVQDVMKAEGISPQEMEDMLAHSALTSLYGYNRRYFHWLFMTVNSFVVAMANDTVVEVGVGSTRMQEDCPQCGGSRCKKCNWHGFIRRLID